VEFVVDVGGGEREKATDDGAAEFGGDVGGGGAGEEGGFGGVCCGERWDEDEEEGEEENVHGAERTWGAGGMFWVGVWFLEVLCSRFSVLGSRFAVRWAWSGAWVLEGDHEFCEGHEWDEVLWAMWGVLTIWVQGG